LIRRSIIYKQDFIIYNIIHKVSLLIGKVRRIFGGDTGPNQLRIFSALIFTTLLLNGCYKFEGDQTVPSYLTIDTMGIKTYYPDEGSKSSAITDAWVYVNDNLVGVFELPAVLPVLHRGPNELQILSGIKLNGISSTRVPYPFYKPVVYDNFEFIEDSVLVLKNVVTEYYPNTLFAWMEDFEGIGNTLDETSISDTVILKTEPGDPNAFLTENSKYSGVVYLTDDNPIYSALSHSSYQLPKQGSPVVLELDYKTDNYFNVGLLIQEYGTLVKVPLVIVNHSDDWNKIYINLGPNLSLHPNADSFKVLIEAGLELEKTRATMYLDNIKLVHRP